MKTTEALAIILLHEKEQRALIVLDSIKQKLIRLICDNELPKYLIESYEYIFDLIREHELSGIKSAHLIFNILEKANKLIKKEVE